MRTRRTHRRPRRGQLGMTLLEAIISLAVFATGVAALFGMITDVGEANRSLAFQNNSLDLFTRISAQIREAQCDYDANVPAYALDPALMDPGLSNLGAWIPAPVPGSAITAFGAQVSAPMRDYVPAMAADYRVLNATPPVGTGAQPPPTLLIEVRIREWMNDPVKDDTNLTAAPWIRNYPVQKLCAPRYGLQPRGAFF